MMMAVVMPPAMPIAGMVVTPMVHIGAMRPTMPVVIVIVIAISVANRDIADVESNAHSGARRRHDNQGGGQCCDGGESESLGFHESSFRVGPSIRVYPETGAAL